MSVDPAIRDHQAWLGYLQPDGLVVSPAALVDAQAMVDRNALPLQERFLEHVEESENADGETLSTIPDVPTFLRKFLEWPDDCLFGLDPARPIPNALRIPLPELGAELTPTYAFRDPKPKDSAAPWLLLGLNLPTGTDLDRREAGSDSQWSASQQQRFERLLRDTKVPIGLLLNGTSIRLVYAPQGENSGSVTFPVQAMSEVAGRPILSALDLLLNGYRLLAAPTEARLPALLRKSREYQSTVSSLLAQQVLDSLYELLRGFQAADERTRGELLREVLSKHSDQVYSGLLTVMLRLVFLLYSEDRGLMPGSDLYLRNYSIHGLFERLRSDNEHYPDTMDQRFGAWSQLLALFRVVFTGCRHPQMAMPPRSGHLFDPARFPFLEGAINHQPSTIPHEPFPVPLVPDGVIFRVLSKLLILNGERLSYRTLDVEEIGSVYQTIMGFRLEVAAGSTIALTGKRKHKSEVPAPLAINLDALLAIKAADRAKWLKEQTANDVPGSIVDDLKKAESIDDLLAALDRRIARDATPRPVPKGGMILHPTDERRRSGSHYTPRALTQPIVRKTLEPILKRMGEKPTPEQILELKICDPAMGSAAFLVETCRQLADELVKAWHTHGKTPAIPPDEDEVLLARRVVAQRCLYGVDRNPMAVDLAKLSLWLVTLAKDHPFTFIDHALKCGDSLVGLTRQQIADFHWRHIPQRVLGQDYIEKRINAATKVRHEILDGGDTMPPELKRQKLEAADEALALVRFAGDLVIAAFFNADNDKQREANRNDYLQRLTTYLIKFNINQRPTDIVTVLHSGQFPVTPFHWEIEFPEVFRRNNTGFDAFVGNPPFLGGTRIEPALGSNYRDYIVERIADGQRGLRGAADLCAYFYLRTLSLVAKPGNLGLLATNSLPQGDSRVVGLKPIIAAGAQIYGAIRSMPWPGGAATHVAVVWISSVKDASMIPLLDGKDVKFISAALSESDVEADTVEPLALQASSDIAFEGAKIAGIGFVLPEKEARQLIREDPKNAAIIQPYLIGDDVNQDPAQRPSRWVINFRDMPLERDDSMDGAKPVACDFQKALMIAKDRVWTERQKLDDDTAWNRGIKARWWQFGLWRPALDEALRNRSRAIVTSRVTAHHCFALVDTSVVFSDRLVVIARDDWETFALVSSRIHEYWAHRPGATTQGTTLNYFPSRAFVTFPFPAGFEKDAAMEAAGREYYEFRAALMVRNNEALTKTYNRFHNPEETSRDILRLRELHAAMDRAVLDAYGWADIQPTCEFILDFEDDVDEEAKGKNRKRKKPWHYRWPDPIRDEVLARLLALNAQRAEEERLAGEHTMQPKKAAKRDRNTKVPNAHLEFAL